MREQIKRAADGNIDGSRQRKERACLPGGVPGLPVVVGVPFGIQVALRSYFEPLGALESIFGGIHHQIPLVVVLGRDMAALNGPATSFSLGDE